jgi:hypothetical protein
MPAFEAKPSGGDAAWAVMPHADDGAAGRGEARCGGRDGIRGGVVERSVGFVEQQDARLGEKRAQERDAGRLAHGQAGGVAVERRIHAETREAVGELCDAGGRLLLADAEAPGELEVVANGPGDDRRPLRQQRD